jgi:tetratricopeptide (TPR) repeat protein
LENLARQGPLITVWEDIHWADATMLDLIEYTLDLAVDSPILLLCLARAELLETRPGWGGSRPNSTTLRLEPLAGEASALVLNQLPGGGALPAGLRSRVLEAAEGNPLYLEEMVGMLVDQGHLADRDGQWQAQGDLNQLEVPPSVKALLASRIDALPASERSVAKRASVVGRIFDASAVREMTQEGAGDVAPSLLGLVRKELVRPERSDLTAGDAFKFRHLLIRDAAYEALAKGERAELHARFADWLENTAGDRVNEYQEVIGYHLEQAYRYRKELGLEEGTHAIAERAADMLGAAGRRAAARSDVATTIDLLERAEALWPRDSAQRLRSLIDLADALNEVGQRKRGLALVEEGLATANRLGDPGLRAHLVLAYRAESEDPSWPELAERDVAEVLPVLEGLGDAAGMALAWLVLASAHWQRMRVAPASEAWEKAAESFAKAGDVHYAARSRAWILVAMLFGRRPVAECLAAANAELERVRDLPAARAEVLWTVSNTKAMVGDYEGAREALEASRAIERDLGRDATASHYATQVAEENAWYEGDVAERLRVLREGLEIFQRATGQQNPLLSAQLAIALAEEGDVDTAEALALVARDSELGDMQHVRVLWQRALALCRARQGAVAEAQALVNEALTTMRSGDFIVPTADTLLTKAEVMKRCGKHDEALEAAREALALYEAKGVAGLIKHTRHVIDALGSN